MVVVLYTLIGSHHNFISRMRTALSAAAAFMIGLQCVAAQPLAAHPRPHRLIVKARQGVTSEQLDRLQENRRTLKRLNGLGKMRVVQLDPSEGMDQALKRFRASGLVEFAEPDYPLRASIVPNDPHFTSGFQWSLRNSSTGRDIHASEGWDILNSASDVIVAVVDSGILYTHEDLAANMWRNPGELPNNGNDDDGNGIVDDVYGINAVNGSGDPMDDGDHGTHVAGIIGGVGNNGKGITGVAWNVKLMACKFLDSDGYGYTSDAIESIDYARRMGAQVINASFGGEEYSNALFQAIQSARNAGIIFVTAAGNEQMNIDQYEVYPACYSLDNIVVVGGSTRSDTFDSSYSNFGVGNVDLFAPGTTVYSTWGDSDNSYKSETGTSMASPHVAGAVALMKARFTNLTSSQIISRLLASVDVLPAFSDRCKTGGRLNLGKALGPNPWANFTASTWIGEPPLTVSFTNLSLGEVQSYAWDFGDGSATLSEPHPSHVFTRPGDFTVRLTAVGTNGQTNSLSQVVRVVSNYQVVPEGYSWISPSGMNRISLTDNGVSPAQALPFSFAFFGVPQSSLYIGANGILGFSADGLANRDNFAMPNSAAPNGIIAPFWDDLNPGAAGAAVYAGTIGTEPNRRFVVTWLNVPRVANSALMSFQAILEEGSEDIVFQYRQVDGGRSATVGVENLSGNTAALHSHNGSPYLLANSSALRIERKEFRFLSVKQSSLDFEVVQGAASPSLTLDLQNTGNTQLDWSISSESGWLIPSTPSGSLNAAEGAQVQIQLTSEALALEPGVHEAILNVSNTSDGEGSIDVPVTINIQSGISTLEFTSATETQFTGGLGGPFAPGAVEVILRNSGTASLQWSGTPTDNWILVTPESGELAAGESASVMVGISTHANLLADGAYTGSVQFVNLAAPDTQTFSQPVQLQINARLDSSSIEVLDGEFRAEIAAAQPGTYAVEYSVDLVQWETLTTAPAQNGAVSFVDPITPGLHRFYRLRLL